MSLSWERSQFLQLRARLGVWGWAACQYLMETHGLLKVSSFAWVVLALIILVVLCTVCKVFWRQGGPWEKTDLRTEPQLLHCYLLGSDVLLIQRQSPLPQAPDLILLQHFDPAGLVIQVRNSLTKPTSNAKHGWNRRRVVIESRGSMVFKWILIVPAVPFK